MSLPSDHLRDAVTAVLVPILRAHRVASFTARCVHELLLLACGLRTATLVDFTLPRDAVRGLLRSLRVIDARFSTVCAVIINGDAATFLVQRTAFERHARQMRERDFAPLVLIAVDHKPHPVLVTGADRRAIIDELRALSDSVQAALSGGISDSDSASPVQLAEMTLSGADVSRLTLPTVCGYLLSYPCVYCYTGGEGVTERNSLSGQSLTVVTAEARLVGSDRDVRALSFSFPQMLEAECRASIDAWFTELEQLFGTLEPPLYESLAVNERTVCESHVSL